MIDDRDLLERELRRFEPEPGLTERVYRRRDRKQRNQRLRAGAVGILVVILTAAALTRTLIFRDPPAGEPTPPPPPAGQLQTVSIIDVGSGTSATLTVPPGARELDVSPDGSMIAYVDRDEIGNDQVFVMQADGTDPRQVTTGERDVSTVDGAGPSWSPDMSMIAYGASTDEGRELFVVDVAGGATTQLTRESEDVVGPAGWTRDAASVYYSVPNYDLDHFTTNTVDLATLRSRIVVEDGSGPAAAPDGESLAFNSWRKPDPLVQLIIARPDGTDRQVVARLDNGDGLQRWSPDSSKLAYNSWAPDGSYEVFVYDLVTGRTTPVAEGPLESWLDDEHILVS